MDILIISPKNSKIENLLVSITVEHKIFTTDNFLKGLALYNKIRPSVLFIDYALPQINGVTFCQILRDMMVKDSISYKDLTIFMLLSASQIKEDFTQLSSLNIKFFIEEPMNEALFKLQMMNFFSNFKTGFDTTLEESVKRAQISQASTLPDFIENENLSVNYIYSPFLNLSGDLFNYWLEEDILYGYLFDCKGHDLTAWRQTAKIKTIFNYAFRFYNKGIFKSLIDVMNNVNEEVLYQMDADQDKGSYVVAIIFKLDIKSGRFCYIPAGLPSLYVKNEKAYREVSLCSDILGFSAAPKFEEEYLNLNDKNELILCTDGLSELLEYEQKSKDNKKDDITAIFINLKNVSDSDTKEKEG